MKSRITALLGGLLCLIGIAAGPLPSGTDLSPIIEAAAAHSTIETLPPPATYTLSRTTTVKADWVTLNMHGAALSAQVSTGSAGNLIVNGQGFTFDGANVTKGVTFLRIYGAHARILSCKSPNGAISANFIWTDGATDCQIIDSDVGETGSVSIYIGGGSGSIENVLSRGGIGEYNNRFEPSVKGVHGNGWLVQDSTFIYKNAFAKDSVVGVREGDYIRFFRCTLYNGNIRYGQSPAAGAPAINLGDCNKGCDVSQCKFIYTPGAYMVPIAIYSGSDITGDANEFWMANGHPIVAVDHDSRVNLTNTVAHFPASLIPVVNNQPQFPLLFASTSKGTHSDAGTKMDMVWVPPAVETAVPATQPASPPATQESVVAVKTSAPPILPSATIAGSSIVRPETGTASILFAVTLSKASASAVSINYRTVAVTASSGSGDYVGVSSANLVIPAGKQSGTISVQVQGKAQAGAKTFQVMLLSANGATLGATSTATGTIAGQATAKTK